MKSLSAPNAAIAAPLAHRLQYLDRNFPVPLPHRKATQPPHSTSRATIRFASLRTSRPQPQTVTPASSSNLTGHRTLPTFHVSTNSSNSCHVQARHQRTRSKTSSKTTSKLARTNSRPAIRRSYGSTPALRGMIRPKWSTDACTRRDTWNASRYT